MALFKVHLGELMHFQGRQFFIYLCPFLMRGKSLRKEFTLKEILSFKNWPLSAKTLFTTEAIRKSPVTSLRNSGQNKKYAKTM